MTIQTTALPGVRQASRFNPIEWRRWWLAIDRNEAAIAWAQTLPGQAALHVGLLVALSFIPISQNQPCRPDGDRAGAVLGPAATSDAWFLTVTGLVYFLLRPFKMGPHYEYFEQIAVPLLPMLPAALISVPFGLLFLGFTIAMLRNQDLKILVFRGRPPAVVHVPGGRWPCRCDARAAT